MKKELISVDKERGIFRVTTLDERFYGRTVTDAETGLPQFEWRPSITYIAGHYPKGKGFEQFLKKNGDESEVIAQLAAERGSKVHQAIEQLNLVREVTMGDKFLNTRTGQDEDLTPDEYACVMAYADWWKNEGAAEYEILEAEDVIWPEGPRTEAGGILHFAATRDIRLRRKSDGSTGTVDVKTSQEIHASHIIQVSAIAEASDDAWQAILRVGYRRNKNRYKFDLVERRLDLLEAAQTIYRYEAAGEAPLQREFPLSLSLNLPKPEAEEELDRAEKAAREAEAQGEPELAKKTRRKAAKERDDEDIAVEEVA